METLHICLCCFLYFLYMYVYSCEYRTIESAVYTRVFGTPKRSRWEHSAGVMIFKQGLLNFRVKNENSGGLQCMFLFILHFQNICIFVGKTIMTS